MTRYRPVVVDVPEEGTFQIQFGGGSPDMGFDRRNPPRIFRQLTDGRLRRIHPTEDNAELLTKVARALRDGTDARREFEEAEARKRRRWTYRAGRKLGKWARALWARLNEPIRWGC